jgi:hypothetical protein
MMLGTQMQLTQMGKIIIFHSDTNISRLHSPKFNHSLPKDLTLTHTMICQGLNYAPCTIHFIYDVHTYMMKRNSCTNTQ